MPATIIGGYRYFDLEEEAIKAVKSNEDIVDYEKGLGWYSYNKKEYKANPRKRLFGF